MTIEPTIPKRPVPPAPVSEKPVEPPPAPSSSDGATATSLPTPDEVKTALRAVVDPEINMNIIDLGLVYDVEVTPEGDVEVRMALTSPGCPFGPQIVQNVTDVSKGMPGVRDAYVEIVWDPPWGPHRMSEEARLIFGF